MRRPGQTLVLPAVDDTPLARPVQDRQDRLQRLRPLTDWDAEQLAAGVRPGVEVRFV